jgi:hypothetical protein
MSTPPAGLNALRTVPRPPAHPSPLKDAFSAMSRHANLVEQASREVVGDSLDGGTDPTVRALRDAKVLRPAGDRGYRLHSRLREFVLDLLQSHSKYQHLTGIGPMLAQISELWRTLQDLRDAREYDDADDAAAQMEMFAEDINEAMDRNLRLLGMLLNTRFGDVRSLAAKDRQNSFYLRESKKLTHDLVQLQRTLDVIARDARERGLRQLAGVLSSAVLTHLPLWTQTVSQFQTQIRQDLFTLREIERKNVLLARAALLVRQNPGWKGLPDVALPEVLAPALLSPAVLGPPVVLGQPPIQVQLKVHMDPQDNDLSIRELYQDEVSALPALARRPAPAPEKCPPIALKPPMAPTLPESTPALRALARLAKAAVERDLAHGETAGLGLSVMQWRRGDAGARQIPARLWLPFAVTALRSYKFDVRLVKHEPEDRFSYRFYDARVLPTVPARKEYATKLSRVKQRAEASLAQTGAPHQTEAVR